MWASVVARSSIRRDTGGVPLSCYDLDRDALDSLLDGEPRYRVDQVWTGLYTNLVTVDELTTLPKPLRQRLLDAFGPGLELVTESVSDDGETIKWLWKLHDGATIETVLMHYPDRTTVCVSSQAGCAMGCTFCATGQAGFTRHLTTGEIVEQVVVAARRSRQRDARLSNVVFMGMGEPLSNLKRVWPAVQRIHSDIGLSARNLTISTVGVVPGIRKLARAELPVSLAVSLHAANNKLRSSLIPLDDRYPLEVLSEALHDYLAHKNRRISLEWALIDGVNDRDTDVVELAEFARPLRAHVNLIPLNPTPGYLTRGSPAARVNEFRAALEDLGINATVRRNRGNEIAAACGQLAAVSAKVRSSRTLEQLR